MLANETVIGGIVYVSSNWFPTSFVTIAEIICSEKVALIVILLSVPIWLSSEFFHTIDIGFTISSVLTFNI